MHPAMVNGSAGGDHQYKTLHLPVPNLAKCEPFHHTASRLRSAAVAIIYVRGYIHLLNKIFFAKRLCGYPDRIVSTSSE